MVVDHPQMHVVHRLERRILDGSEFDVVLATDFVAIVAVDQHVAPQDKRVAATFGKQTLFEGSVFIRRERIDVRLEFLVNLDCHECV